MKIEYKITFELENKYHNNEEWGRGSFGETSLCDAICVLIDQGKSDDVVPSDVLVEHCLAKIKKHIGKFDLEAREVNN